jgi:hypothetical protein
VRRSCCTRIAAIFGSPLLTLLSAAGYVRTQTHTSSCRVDASLCLGPPSVCSFIAYLLSWVREIGRWSCGHCGLCANQLRGARRYPSGHAYLKPYPPLFRRTGDRARPARRGGGTGAPGPPPRSDARRRRRTRLLGRLDRTLPPRPTEGERKGEGERQSARCVKDSVRCV